MKTTSILLLMTSLSLNLFAQTSPHQSAPPPVNPGYAFTRSLMVDCTKDILYDMAFGSQQGEEADLLDYVQDNYISYVILGDLENAGVFGDPVYEAMLHQLIFDIHLLDPDMQVGISASVNAFQTPMINPPQLPKVHCYGEKVHFYLDPASFAQNKKIEPLVAFFQATDLFEKKYEAPSFSKPCLFNFDALYLNYPYWNTTSSMADMQSDFENYKNVLNLMNAISCNSACIRFVDAEFLPSDIYRLQGWTAIDQITEADTLIDRIVIPAYTDDASAVFDMRCKLMHWLSDQFSKTGSNIFMKLSAESSTFSYCNSPTTPNDFLGDYLNGTVSPSGNMYSVEQKFVDFHNNFNYVCPACNCSTYVDNHYTPAHPTGNKLSGIIWTPYTMLQTHQLTRKKDTGEVNPGKEKVILFDVTGRCLGEFESQSVAKESMKKSGAGIYFLKDSDGNVFKLPGLF